MMMIPDDDSNDMLGTIWVAGYLKKIVDKSKDGKQCVDISEQSANIVILLTEIVERNKDKLSCTEPMIPEYYRGKEIVGMNRDYNIHCIRLLLASPRTK